MHIKGRSRDYYSLPSKLKGRPQSGGGKAKLRPAQRSTSTGSSFKNKAQKQLRADLAQAYIPRLSKFWKDLMKQKKISTSPYRIRLRRNK